MMFSEMASGSKRQIFCATEPANSATSCGRYPTWRPSTSDHHTSRAAASSRPFPPTACPTPAPRWQHPAQALGGGAETASDIAGALIAGQVILVGHAPAFGQAPRHTHCDQYFGVAPAGGGEIVAARGQAHGLARGLAGHEF